MEKNKTEKAVEIKTAPKFTKEQLLSAERFSGRKDALGALLRDNREYTIAEAEGALDKFMKGKVM